MRILNYPQYFILWDLTQWGWAWRDLTRWDFTQWDFTQWDLPNETYPMRLNQWDLPNETYPMRPYPMRLTQWNLPNETLPNETYPMRLAQWDLPNEIQMFDANCNETFFSMCFRLHGDVSFYNLCAKWDKLKKFNEEL